MRWSRTFIPTLRDDPADAESRSQKLLIRAGFLRPLAAGVFSCLPLGRRTLSKIARIIREEMNAAGAQEFLLPMIHPADLYPEPARRSESEEDMFRLRDRAGRDLCLSMTGQNVFMEIARKEIRSYKDLPQIWYQIQSGFRDQFMRKSGLLTLREFAMCESCSFDVDQEGLDRSYRTHHSIYCRILERCGLNATVVTAESDARGIRSEMFAVRAEAGKDLVVSCTCGYAASLDCATSKIPQIEDTPAPGDPKRVHTPNQKTIAEIAGFLKVPPTHQIKSLVYAADGTPVMFLVRGDHQLNESKTAAATAASQTLPATPDEIRSVFGADAGSLGPVGVEGVQIYADFSLQGRQSMTCGANSNDYHLQGVTPGVHFKPVWVDLRTVEKGDACVKCGGPLDLFTVAEVGKISKLGSRFSDSRDASILAADGRPSPVVRGIYEIGLDRILSLAVELRNDEDGIVWPTSIAPFTTIITPISYQGEVKAAADNVYDELVKAGLDVLLDDRGERPGVKFKDADLIGIPYRIVIGTEKLRLGKIELFERAGRTKELLNQDQIVPVLKARLGG